MFCWTHVLLDSCFAGLMLCWTRVLLDSCLLDLSEAKAAHNMRIANIGAEEILMKLLNIL